MTTFTGTSSADVANATTGTLTGFTGGTVADLQDGTGDVFLGLAGKDTIVGGDGNDTITGGADTDSLSGGLGDDQFIFQSSDSPSLDVIDGGSGTDRVVATGSLSLSINNVTSIEEIEFQTTLSLSLTVSGSSIGGSGISSTATIFGDGNANTLQIASASSLDISGWTLTSWSASDVINIFGTSGDDSLIGSSGRDLLQAGEGADTLIGGGGNDVFSYGDASDLASGESIDGGAGTFDAISISVSGDYDFRLATIANVESLQIANNSGLLTVTLSSAQLAGLPSGFQVSGSSASNALTVVASTNSGETIDISVLTFTNWSDSSDVITVVGGTGNDKLTGSAKSDIFKGLLGDDTIIGGSGTDTIDNSSATNAVSITLDASGNGTAAGTDVGNDKLTSIEVAKTGSGADSFTITGLAVRTLDGGGGVDAADYSSVSSNITLTVGAVGADQSLLNIESITGGSGNDTFEMKDSGDNTIDGGAGGADAVDYSSLSTSVAVAFTTTLNAAGVDVGTDTLENIEKVKTGSGDDTFDLADFEATLDGGGGSDTADFSNASSGITVDVGDVSTGSSRALSNIEAVIGSAGDDIFYVADTGDNDFDGGGGADRLDYSESSIVTDISVTLGSGGTGIAEGADIGTDTLTSIERIVTGSGSDTFVSSDAADNLFDGDGGIDTIDYSLLSTSVVVDLAGGKATGIDVGLDELIGIESVVTGSGNDTVAVALDSEALDGGAGLDTVSYESSASGVTVNLLLSIATGADIGTDTLLNFENAVGSGSDDTLIGDALGNALDGGGGADTLTGGMGTDTLTGGAGADVFDFNDKAETAKSVAASDVVVDFDRTELDLIDLSGIDAKKGGIDQAFRFIGTAKFHHRAGELRYKSDGAGGAIVEGDTDGNGKADFRIHVEDVGSLLKTDFVL